MELANHNVHKKSYPKTLSQPYTILLPVWPPNVLATEGSKIHTFECKAAVQNVIHDYERERF
jgi:hypothetical protein